MKLLPIALMFASVLVADPVLSLTAVTANVAGAPDSIRIDVLRWSTAAERDQLMAAWSTTGAGPAAPGRGRGGRGRGAPATSATQSPEESLATALKQAPTVGYLWSSEVAGYALRYAGKVKTGDGVERIVLITDRRIGKTNDLWQPSDARSDFSVIELRGNEGKISLTGKVAPDSAAGIVAPENYAALPVVLKNVKAK